MIDIKEIIETRDGTDYQRDNFDSFLEKTKFSFNVPSIHIAGTNGKGTTANYIAAIYQKAGYKVGLYTSPSLYEINETISINGEMISDEDIKSIVKEKTKEIAKFGLSSFEVLTYVAFIYFQKQQCDICVIECGMGGEIDATNIFTPVLSIITSVSLEHTNFLGKSISEIALQKAGIIKDEIPVLLGDMPEDAIDVISEASKEHNSKAYSVGDAHQPTLGDEGYYFSYGTHNDIRIQSKAFYSVKNACLALDAVDLLKDKFPIDEEDIKAGLSSVQMICRMEYLPLPVKTIVDGGHNPEAFEKLSNSLQKAGLNSQIHVLLACFKDKNLIQMLSTIGAIADTITLTTFDHPRAREEADFFLFLSDYEFIEDPVNAYNKLTELYPEDIILITGSLAFAAYMRKRLKDDR